MKSSLVLLVCLLAATLAFGQAVDLGQVQLSDLDLTQADLSEASLYFAGPVDLLITNVRYMGMTFTALLKYDGKGGIEVAAPPVLTPEALPTALDFSKVRFEFAPDGILVNDLIADGYYFSGKLVPTPSLGLALAPPLVVGGSAVPPDRSAELGRLLNEAATLRQDVNRAERSLDAALTARTQAEQSLADSQARVATLEAQLQAASVQPTGLVEAALQVTRPVVSGWAGGSGVLGSWTLAGTTLRQTSASQFFAKYALPVQQNANELVYTFRGTGAATGWSGYGLHFLASGSRNGTLYGYGTSYLVWVTRDPGNTQSDQTFVQLYRSYDDVKMVQVASKAITGSIDRALDVAVYVNRATGIIGVGIGQQLVLDYRDPAIIRTGAQVAARTLGSATISDLNVTSR